MTRDEFINDRWVHHQMMMDAPRGKRAGEDCHDRHGGSWDWWVWGSSSNKDRAAEEYDDERAYCGSCGKIIRGVKSPWAKKALEDWKNTSAYQRREYERHVAAQRKTIKFERPGWSRTWFGGVN